MRLSLKLMRLSRNSEKRRARKIAEAGRSGDEAQVLLSPPHLSISLSPTNPKPQTPARAVARRAAGAVSGLQPLNPKPSTLNTNPPNPKQPEPSRGEMKLRFPEHTTGTHEALAALDLDVVNIQLIVDLVKWCGPRYHTPCTLHPEPCSNPKPQL